MRITAILLLVAVGCGTDKDSNDSAPAPEQQSVADETAPESQAVPYSMALASAAELPPCDEAHNQQLVYLLDSKEFQTCQAGAWQVVEIQAPEPAGPALVEVKNLLSTIQLKDKMADIVPEARALLLGKLATHTTDTHDDCSPALPADIYDVHLDDYDYRAIFRGGVVDTICDGDADCEIVGCTDR
jgi:hypothetical protein